MFRGPEIVFVPCPAVSSDNVNLTRVFLEGNGYQLLLGNAVMDGSADLTIFYKFQKNRRFRQPVMITIHWRYDCENMYVEASGGEKEFHDKALAEVLEYLQLA